MESIKTTIDNYENKIQECNNSIYIYFFIYNSFIVNSKIETLNEELKKQQEQINTNNSETKQLSDFYNNTLKTSPYFQSLFSNNNNGNNNNNSNSPSSKDSLYKLPISSSSGGINNNSLGYNDNPSSKRRRSSKSNLPLINNPSPLSNINSSTIPHSDQQQAINDKIEVLSQQNMKNTTQVSKLQATVNGLTSSLANIQKTISAHKDQLNKHIEKNPFDTLKKKLIEIEYKLSSLDDLETCKSNITNLQTQLKDLNVLQQDLHENTNMNDLNIKSNRQRIDETRAMLSTLQSLVDAIQQACAGFLANPIDFNKFITVPTFNEYKHLCEGLFIKHKESITNINKKLDTYDTIIRDKVSQKDIQDLKDFILLRLEELGLACNSKFADQNETFRSIKMLEQSIRNLHKELLKRDKGDNWLIAKKPLNGHMCASCEAYLGDLKDNKKDYIHWNKYPMRDLNDFKYKQGSGYSKMLQMINNEGDYMPAIQQKIMNNSQSMKMFSSATARYSVDGGNIVEGVESQRNNNDIKEDVNEEDKNGNGNGDGMIHPKITKIVKLDKN